jgi:hypothetical protein
MEDDAKGLPFLKGRTLKVEGERLFCWVVSKSWVLRVSRAEIGEDGSSGFGVLDLKGLPAKAWDFKFMAMVDVVLVLVMVRCERVVVKVCKKDSFLERERR